ncbi:MAG: gamma-glutamyl-gamma-aminobutyrate hydrolase family protein [Myxococcota bacterium]
MSNRPLIALSPNEFPAEERKFYKNKPLEYGEATMAVAVRRAGGLPVMPYRAGLTDDQELALQAEAVMSRLEGLLLTGGADVSPLSYGEEPLKDAWRGDLQRDRWEIALYRAAVKLGRPVLAVCRGAQVVNVAEGGTLWQDLVTQREGSKVHRSQELYDTLSHDVRIAPDSELHGLFGDEPHHVNTVHHQGLKDMPACLRETAWSPEGIVEAFEREGSPWVLGVQWHPEWMLDRPSQLRLFEALVARARRVRGG